MSKKEEDKKLSFMPLFIKRFMLGTSDWDDEEVGAYIRLLCSQWNNGYITNFPHRKKIVDTEEGKALMMAVNDIMAAVTAPGSENVVSNGMLQAMLQASNRMLQAYAKNEKFENISRKFTPQGKGFFVNEVLENIRKGNMISYDSKTVKARNAAYARWGDKTSRKNDAPSNASSIVPDAPSNASSIVPDAPSNASSIVPDAPSNANNNNSILNNIDKGNSDLSLKTKKSDQTPPVASPSPKLVDLKINMGPLQPSVKYFTDDSFDAQQLDILLKQDLSIIAMNCRLTEMPMDKLEFSLSFFCRTIMSKKEQKASNKLRIDLTHWYGSGTWIWEKAYTDSVQTIQWFETELDKYKEGYSKEVVDTFKTWYTSMVPGVDKPFFKTLANFNMKDRLAAWKKSEKSFVKKITKGEFHVPSNTATIEEIKNHYLGKK